MEMGKPTRSRLTPADWARAAFRAIARGGIDAVAIEPLAAELGATKGSFYWHFENREALIEAALDEWERHLTDHVIDELERISNPAERLKKLLAGAFQLKSKDRAAEVVLLANPDHTAVRNRVRHVAQRRISYMAQQLEALGWSPAEALDRAVLLSYLYVGYLQMAHMAPDAVNNDVRRRHVELVFESFIAQADPVLLSAAR